MQSLECKIVKRLEDKFSHIENVSLTKIKAIKQTLKKSKLLNNYQRLILHSSKVKTRNGTQVMDLGQLGLNP